MVPLHRLIGLGIGVVFLVIGLWGIVGWARNRDPGPWFWRLLGVAQASLGVQALVGVVLFLMGGRRPWVHYLYGAFPIAVLIFTHRASKRLKGLEWVAFAFASLFIFGLQLRGMMTGSGG